MSATERIRELLDERGVDWIWVEGFDGIRWQSDDNRIYGAKNGSSFNGPTGKLDVYGLTPEQAIEVTLGRGECHRECYDIDMLDGERSYWCSACHSKRIRYGDKYCPNCGAKVVVL